MKLNSFDEWSQLREVILGSAQNYVSHNREISFDFFFHDNLKIRSEWYYPRVATSLVAGSLDQDRGHAIKQRYVEELNEDLEGIAETLRTLGVTVYRPITLDPSTSQIQALAWSAGIIPALNVRDIALILGDEIVETAPMLRSRYFETQLLAPIFGRYFREGARWSLMPRPIMTDASFDPSYAQQSVGGPMEPIQNPSPSPYDVGFEMMFDGAQCLRLGRDVVVNVSTENHELGYQWLQRNFADRFRIHRIHRLSDSHIDSMVLALRPGTLLVRSNRVIDFLPDALKRWDLIIAPEPEVNNFPTYDDDDLILTSLYIDLNILSINENTVMVNDACPELTRLLERHGFAVASVRHRHRRLFGGGFHCFTLDTVRDGGMETYL